MTDFLPRIDQAIAACGTTQHAASVAAGHKGIIEVWRNKARVPRIDSLADVCEALHVDPAWAAYGDKPMPVPVASGYHAKSVNQLSPKMEMVFDAWQEDGLGLDLFNVLERTGLRDSIYLLTEVDTRLRYDHIGTLNMHTLGWEWWTSAPGEYVGEADPDPRYAHGCLYHYLESLRNKVASRHRVEASSGYTGEDLGWIYDRLCLWWERNEQKGVLVVNEVVA